MSNVPFQYYSKALATPLGQKVKRFYTDVNKQAFDIHEEARRLADSHKAAGTHSEPSAAEQHGAALSNAAGKEAAPVSVGGPVDSSAPSAPTA